MHTQLKKINGNAFTQRYIADGLLYTHVYMWQDFECSIYWDELEACGNVLREVRFSGSSTFRGNTVYTHVHHISTTAIFVLNIHVHVGGLDPEIYIIGL